MPPRRAVRPLALLVAALASACAGVLPGPREAPPRTYLLAPALAGGGSRPSVRASGPTLLVSPVESAAGFDTRRMAYLERDYRLDYFADHAWVDSPAAMLGPLLVQVLSGSGAFAAVTGETRGIAADLRLDTVVESLYQDFRTRPSVVRVTLRVSLADANGRALLATRTLEDSEPAATDDPYGGVVAANRVLSRLLPQIAAFAAESGRQSRPGSDE